MGGVWKERSEGGQGVMGLTLGHLHSLPPGYWKVFEEKKKNSEQVKTEDCVDEFGEYAEEQS